MAWRTIHLNQRAHLKVKQKKLHIGFCKKLPHENCEVPLEDINAIIIDSPEVTLTSTLLGELGLAKVVVLISDKKHTPSTIIHSYLGHSRQTGVVRMQMSMGKPLKKRLWQRIVAQKIKNQNEVLKTLGRGPILEKYLKQVKSDDSDNREAVAARVYWSHLFKDKGKEEFERSNKIDGRNGALNYGYAVVRSLLVRGICAGGLLPLWGIHHDSELNEFNLADDLFEPFRPWVDYVVAKEDLGLDGDLDSAEKRKLMNVLSRQVQMDSLHYDVSEACSKTVQSFKNCLKLRDCRHLELPEFISC